jgi:2-polyprenyl-3-methyl-5-hydroxy-6-metoxy-1,4-benzoquinol methylase
VSATLLVKAMASVIEGQDGLGDGLAVGLATGADTATGELPPAGTAALAALNCKAAPANAPNVIPPVMAAAFVMFIVPGTTRGSKKLVRNQRIIKLCITNWTDEPFDGLRIEKSTTFGSGAKKVVCSATRRW